MASDVMDAADIERSLRRIAHEIIEKNRGAEGVVVLGIPTRGVPLANRLAGLLAENAPWVESGSIDITPYRDDLKSQPMRTLERTRIPDSGLDGRLVVLVDDVLFSGRTIRAALDAIGDIGRPSRIQLAVLVDRGHRELPIRADYVGKNLPTSREERVTVRVAEIDGSDSVAIEGGK